MKKIVLSISLVALLGLSFTSCRETEKAKEKVEEVAEDAAEATEDAMEETGKVIDEAIEETKEASETVKNAVDEAIVHLNDNESVTVSYSFMSAGKEIKGSKTFEGHQDEVEKAVHKLTDSIHKIDPNVKITVGN